MKTTIIAVITLVLAVAAYWFAAAPESAPHPVDLEQASHSSSTQENAPAVPPVADWTSELVNEFQIQAMAAVTNTLGQPEFTDRIEKRPDFVSPAEWLILSSIAQHVVEGVLHHLGFVTVAGFVRQNPGEGCDGVSALSGGVGVLASQVFVQADANEGLGCLLYTSPSPRDLSTSRMPSSA